MKKTTAYLIAFVMVVSLILIGCAQPTPTTPSPTATSPTSKPTTTTPTTSPPAKVTELTYANFFPPTHWHVVLANEWAKEIGKRTNGTVKITQFPGGSLAAGPKIYDGVVQGIADIGMSVLSYTVGRFPVSELFDMPHGYPSGWVATMALNDYYTKFKPVEFKDVQVLYFHAHGPGMVLTTKKPVRKLEDMKGLVLRSTGVGAAIVQGLGASGYAAAQGEAYELMSKGTIDGSFTPLEVLKGWKQAEVVKYVTQCYDLGYTAGMFVVMNKGKFDALPADAKKAITDVSQEWIEKHARVWSAYDVAAVDYFKTFEGRELIPLAPDEMARWVKAAAPVKDKALADLKAKSLPADEYEGYINERVKYWAGKAPAESEIVKWVQQNVEPLAPK